MSIHTTWPSSQPTAGGGARDLRFDPVTRVSGDLA